MTTPSEYLDRVGAEIWAREVFTFIPDRNLPPSTEVVRPGPGARVAFAGFPSDYSLAFLLSLLQLDVQPVGIITSPGAHPAILGDNALSRIADHLGIPLIRAWRINDEHSRFAVAELKPEAVVMASFDQIVGVRTLALSAQGWLNIHPSLLPAYRGPEPVYWAIADGASETGITLHRAAPRFDSGPILAQARLTIHDTDTAGTLTRRLVAAGVECLGEAVSALLAGREGTALDMTQATYRGSVGHRSLSEAKSAREAERMVRAGVPNMLPWTIAGGRPVYVRAASVVPSAETGSPPRLRYPDADLVLTATQPTCGCHHDRPDCEHRR